MRWFLCVAAVACSSPKPRPAPPVPIENMTRTCTEAAAGLERATVGLRPPESSVLQPMRQRCEQDAWPSAAIDCFATMTEADLGRCAKLLPDSARDAMFGVLGGGDDRTKIAVSRARLENLRVGVVECDHFIAVAATVLACEKMSIEQRLELGETADSWVLPTHGLPADLQHRMATACNTSLASLQQQASSAGCMP